MKDDDNANRVLMVTTVKVFAKVLKDVTPNAARKRRRLPCTRWYTSTHLGV